MDLEVPYFQTTSQAYPGFTASLPYESWKFSPWRPGVELPAESPGWICVTALIFPTRTRFPGWYDARKMQYPTAQLQLEVKKGTVLSQLLPPSPTLFQLNDGYPMTHYCFSTKCSVLPHPNGMNSVIVPYPFEALA